LVKVALQRLIFFGQKREKGCSQMLQPGVNYKEQWFSTNCLHSVETIYSSASAVQALHAAFLLSCYACHRAIVIWLEDRNSSFCIAPLVQLPLLLSF